MWTSGGTLSGGSDRAVAGVLSWAACGEEIAEAARERVVGSPVQFKELYVFQPLPILVRAANGAEALPVPR